MLPAAWLRGPHFIDDAQRQPYVSDNDLQDLPEDVTGFLAFHQQRRKRLEQRLRQALGVT